MIVVKTMAPHKYWEYDLINLHIWLLGGIPDPLPSLHRLGTGQPEGSHRWFSEGHAQVWVDHCCLSPHAQVFTSKGSQLGVDQWSCSYPDNNTMQWIMFTLQNLNTMDENPLLERIQVNSLLNAVSLSLIEVFTFNYVNNYFPLMQRRDKAFYNNNVLQQFS